MCQQNRSWNNLCTRTCFAEAIGGTALWSKQERKTIITIGLQQVFIYTEPQKPWRMSQERINVLNEKINEATDLSSYSQIRTHFRPYFTDSFINKIIHSNGIENNALLTKRPILPTVVPQRRACTNRLILKAVQSILSSLIVLFSINWLITNGR